MGTHQVLSLTHHRDKQCRDQDHIPCRPENRHRHQWYTWTCICTPGTSEHNQWGSNKTSHKSCQLVYMCSAPLCRADLVNDLYYNQIFKSMGQGVNIFKREQIQSIFQYVKINNTKFLKKSTKSFKKCQIPMFTTNSF